MKVGCRTALVAVCIVAVLSLSVVPIDGGPVPLSSPAPQLSPMPYDPDLLFDKGVTFDNISELYPLPPEPRDMAMGDLNDDALPDVAIAFNGSYIYIFNGTATGQLDLMPWNVSLSAKLISDVRSIAIGDLDSDGKNDIAISYTKPGNRVSILYQGQAFSISSSTDLSFSSAAPYQLAIGDFNQDNKNDVTVVVKKDQKSSVYFFLNPFQMDNFREISTVLTNAQFLQTGYINNDQRIDILIANRSGQEVRWFCQPANGDWGVSDWIATTIDLPGTIAYAGLANLDLASGDDLITINSENDRVEVRYNNGNGFAGPEIRATYPGASSLAVGNLTSEGHLDMTLINRDGNNCSILYRTSSTMWNAASSALFPTDRMPIRTMVQGVDSLLPGIFVLGAGDPGRGGTLTFYHSREGTIGNSEQDIMLTGLAPGRMWSGALKERSSVLAALLPASSVILLHDVTTGERSFLNMLDVPSAVVFGDFNGDGNNDIAALEGSNVIRVFDGSVDLFAQPGTPVTFGAGLTSAVNLAAGRAGDADRDILAVGGDGGVVIVYDALDDASRALETIGAATPGMRSSVIIGNFSTVGRGGDVAALNALNGKIEIYKRDPSGAPGSYYHPLITLYSGAAVGISLSSGDYNGDGLQDLAMGCASKVVLIYEQTDVNEGFFSNDGYEHSVAVPSAPAMLFSGDLNDDGRTDIAVGRSDLPLMSMYLSKAGAPFLKAFDLTTGCIATGLSIGDHNGDGRDDLAASSSGSKSISMWFQNNLAPAARASLSSFAILEGETVSFDASASQDSFSDRGSLQYLWHFGDGETSTESVASHLYRYDGFYNGSLTVTDRGGLSSTFEFSVNVADIGPHADITYGPQSPLEGEAVSFRDNSTSYDGIVAYEWDFNGDGLIDSYEKDPVHTFISDGTYNVRLTVREGDGGSDTASVTIEVRDRVPSAAIKPLLPVLEGTAFTVHDDSTSYDTIAFRLWDFGDGTQSSDPEPTHTYIADGTYVITLTVRDADGDTSIATGTIEVLDSSPSADFVPSPNPVSEGASVAFTDGSSAYDGIVSWQWDFGDGNTSVERSPVHAYTMPTGYLSEVYTVTLTVTDGDGSTSQRTRIITVLQTSPAIISLIAEGGAVFSEDQEISFLAYAKKTNFNITGYAWDFDYDQASGFDPVPGVTVNRTYWTFPSAGEYQVCLRVYDYNSYSEHILVVTVRNLPPLAELSHVRSPEGWVTFDATRSTDTPSDLPALMFRWNFGDGKGWTTWSPNATIAHQFDDGSYAVTVQVRDDDGAIVERGITIAIDRLPPVIGYDRVPPTEAFVGDQVRVEVNVTDRSTIAQVVLFYTFGEQTRSISMTRLSGTDLFVATIPSFNATGTLTYYIEATDSQGYSFGTTAVQVSIVPRPDPAVPLTIGAVIAAALLAMFLYARSYNMVVDEVFVIYSDGNLIAHQTRRLKPGMDDEVLSSMLAAVQSFVRDSFKDESSTSLNRLDFGEKKLLVERGQYLIVAAVLHGKREGKAPQRLKEVLEHAEAKYTDVLADWDGDLDKLRGIKEETNDIMRFRIKGAAPAGEADPEGPRS